MDHCLWGPMAVFATAARRFFQVFFLIFSCIHASTGAAETPLKVVATFSILGDLVQQVGGERIELSVIVGPNGDAHVYEPTPADAKKIVQADVVFLNGLGFEGWLERLLQATAYAKPMVAVSADLPARSMETQGEKVRDPHTWHNVQHVQQMVEKIAQTLCQIRPQDADYFRARSQAYQEQLRQLDGWIETMLATIPREVRHIITVHDGFSYFGERYGVSFYAPSGISTDAEPSAQQIKTLIDEIKKGHIRALFCENICNHRLLEQIAEETHTVIGGTLYSDALSPPGTAGDDYLRLMRHNVTTLVAALRQAHLSSPQPQEALHDVH